jgi:hypothetical protein
MPSRKKPIKILIKGWYRCQEDFREKSILGRKGSMKFQKNG